MDSEHPASSHPKSPGAAHERLESWKEIAAYLNRDVRTVQRWEERKNLPVHRIPGKHGAVYAWKSELDSWRNVDHSESRRQPSRPGLTLVLALVAIGIAVSSAWWIQWQAFPDDAPLTPAPLTSYLGYEDSPSFSPDGTHVAFVWDGSHGDNLDIYVKPVGTGEPLRLSRDPGFETSPAWSPDGRHIAFLRHLPGGREAVILVPAFGGEERTIIESAQLAPDPVGPFLAWSPDSRWLVVSRRPSSASPYELDLLSLETLKIRRLTSPPANYWGDSGPALSADGRKLVFSRTRSIGVGELLALSLSENLEVIGEPERVPTGVMYPTSPVWIDNNQVVFSSGLTKDRSSSLFRLRTDFTRIRPTGQTTAQRLPLEAALFATFSAKTGRLAYARAFSDRNIWQLSLADRNIRPENFASSSTDDVTPKFSPDGKKIVFTSSRSGSMEIWVAESDGSHPVKLTSFGGPLTGSPAWSPDSKTIVFDSVAAGDPDLYTVSAQGGAVRRLTTTPSNDAVPGWSHDGKWIYFVSNRAGRDAIWKLPATGGEAVPMHVDGGNPMTSLDGRFVYFVKFEEPPRLWRIPTDGGKEELVLENLANGWSLSIVKSGIYFVGKAAGGAPPPICFLNFATGKVQTIASLEKAIGFGLTVSPDEKVLLYTQLDQAGSDLMIVEHFR